MLFIYNETRVCVQLALQGALLIITFLFTKFRCEQIITMFFSSEYLMFKVLNEVYEVNIGV